ncbi:MULTISPECIES: hypothetical protein [unclassified Bradyrhizobium]|uniref:hypothetical protein n=1 Tax=unclassified Bradyrhizobium TaxID=2631580 RepID=UPI0028E41F68|nr:MULTISPECIES: hypothetical protein [unclassified Bradyrhizobium]
MIWNVIDRRSRPYRWKFVTAIVEAVEHDNSCADADQADEAPVSLVVDYDKREGLSVCEAIQWANAQRCPVTLYIYDADGETTDNHFHACGARFDVNDK